MGQRWFRAAFNAALATLATVAGCDCGGGTEPGCTSSSDCEMGEVCIDNRCVAPGDAGPRPDAGPPIMGECRDGDGDGYEGVSADCPDGLDCNDARGDISPDAAEQCGDGVDNDCDGDVDESECACRVGEFVSCYGGEPETRRVGACRNGIALCTGPGMTGECEGQVTPAEEECNGVDDDCDGMTDEGLRNACGECSEIEPMEICGNEVDDDCDGMADEDCDCDYRCMCPDATDCECRPPTNQPCYEGPFGTEGVGACAGGRRDCVDDGTGATMWAMCTGEVLPSEECVGGAADSIDNDCDGLVDEGCRDADGDGSPWPADCDDTDETIVPGGDETCNERDDDCDGVTDEGVRNGCGGCGEVAAADECGNGLDDDCNGLVDDGCTCELGATQDCYGGPEGTEGVAGCMGGTQTCTNDEFNPWGECEYVGPEPEICDGIDNDCDGEADERYATGSNACGFCDPTEICDGEDQDCDGLVDEGVSNSCGECGEEPVEVCDGLDDDCDGVIDEGTTNACGTCFPEPCFTDEWDTPSDCETMGRDCDGVEGHPDFPDSVTLGENTFDNDFIYVALTNLNEIAKLRTQPGSGGEPEGEVVWRAASHGTNPSRTAVALDGSVWAANRGFANPAVVTNSNVVHLREEDGSLICRAPVTGLARGLAIDSVGNVWAGTWNGQQLWEISGTMVDDSTSPPTCVVLNTYNAQVNIYGLAADGDGNIWTASDTGSRGADISVRMEPATGTMTEWTNPARYGVVADGDGVVWHGDWTNTAYGIHGIQPDGTIRRTSAYAVTAVTVHPDGTIWGTRYNNNQVVKVDPVTGTPLCYGATYTGGGGSNPHGVAVDRVGRIWAPNRYGGYLNVFDTDCNRVAQYPVVAGQEIYSYSDMTGHLLRTFVAPEGFWRQIFDSGYETPYWTSIEWESDEPAGTNVEIYVRVSDTEAGLDTAMPCGPFDTSPADLSTCVPALPRQRYMRVDARLTRGGTDERPILHSVTASWAY